MDQGKSATGAPSGLLFWVSPLPDPEATQYPCHLGTAALHIPFPPPLPPRCPRPMAQVTGRRVTTPWGPVGATSNRQKVDVATPCDDGPDTHAPRPRQRGQGSMLPPQHTEAGQEAASPPSHPAIPPQRTDTVNQGRQQPHVVTMDGPRPQWAEYPPPTSLQFS